eukprot:g5850.t1
MPENVGSKGKGCVSDAPQPPKRRCSVGSENYCSAETKQELLPGHPADQIPVPPQQLWNRLMWGMQQKIQKVEDTVSELSRRIEQGFKDCSNNLEQAFEEEGHIREEYREELLHDAHQDLLHEKEGLDERYSDHVEHIQCEMVAIKTVLENIDKRLSTLENRVTRVEERAGTHGKARGG